MTLLGGQHNVERWPAEFVEFNTSQGPLSRELVKDQLKLQDGFLAVPQGPGLGVEVNDAVIQKYLVA